MFFSRRLAIRNVKRLLKYGPCHVKLRETGEAGAVIVRFARAAIAAYTRSPFEAKNAGGTMMRLGYTRMILAAAGLLTVCVAGGATKAAGQAGQEAKPRMAEEVF